MNAPNGAKLGIRALHLDLKGLPPTADRLMALPRIAAVGGYNALLVEWEDAFPWVCDSRFRSPTAYSRHTVREFAQAASDQGIQLIPLVQCLGHMETPLRYHTHLREIPDRPEVLNVTADGAQQLIEDMIADVLDVLDDVNYFHLGGDEARCLGEHPDTAKAIKQSSKQQVYLEHITPFCQTLSARGIRPILWHDMMCNWSDDSLKQLASMADLCAWHYHGDPSVSGLCTLDILKRFDDAGIKLWLGAAYKGADGADADLPNPEKRIANVQAWMKLHEQIPFVGGVATGWSRHATPGMQNEPIDAALDVMLAVGWTLRDGQVPPLLRCVQALESIGEEQLFTDCKQVMTQLADSRRAAWHMVVQIHQQLAMESVCPEKQGSRILPTITGYLDNYIADVQRDGLAMKQIFDGLIDACWLDEYLQVRTQSLIHAREDLNERLRKHLQ
tara:strand:+ start:142 stop:1476 length:1335 start_codon:yes stop_codon:yes gene_type:complete